VIESRRRWAPDRFLGSLTRSELAVVGDPSEYFLLPSHLPGAIYIIGGPLWHDANEPTTW